MVSMGRGNWVRVSLMIESQLCDVARVSMRICVNVAREVSDIM